MPKVDIQKVIEEHLDNYIYGGPEYEMDHVDYASGLFRQAEDLDALTLLSMMHKRRANISLIMHLMSRSAELYLKSCLARHYLNEGFTQEKVIKELRKASNGIRIDKIMVSKNPSGFLVSAGKIPRNPHSLIQLWQTCRDVLGPKYNLKDNHYWGWVENFCLQDREGKNKEDWYELIYEPNEKIAWSKNGKGGLLNNETGFIKTFAENFLKNVSPLHKRP